MRVVSFCILIASAATISCVHRVDAFMTLGSFGVSSSSRVGVSLSSVTPSAVSTSTASTASTTKIPPEPKKLVLLTFDLDDTLYPIAPVIEEANIAFVKAMERYGFAGIKPTDIDQTCKEIRAEMDEEAVYLTHTQVRELAIRREMEKMVFERKLQETADEWGAPVSDLSDLVRRNARMWAHAAVSESIVNAVLTAWEMERHHAAERNVFPEVADVLKQIKEEHPDVIVGAVTDGKANPMFMTFTLAPYFNFCMSWEDDQGGRSKFFQELSNVEGDAQLTWIYNAAYDKFKDLASAAAAMKAPGDSSQGKGKIEIDDSDTVWIHVGDDLFYDVGGSSSCGARTIWLDLADKYGQTANDRFNTGNKQPAWSTSTRRELETRRVLNEKALSQVDQTVRFMNHLPEAISNILEEEEQVEAATKQEASVSNEVSGTSQP